MPTRLLAPLLTSLALCIAPAQGAAAPIAPLEQALACQEVSDCPYFPEVYKSDRAFRQAFLIELKKANIRRPRWVPDGVTTPVKPVDIDGSPRLLTSVCEPHNCGHRFMLVYDPAEKSMAGMYTGLDQAGEVSTIYFGSPSIAEMTLLKNN
jgi:hypothetical protein